MKAIVVREFGGPEVMRVESIADLVPSTGQVLVKIHAAGVNPADTYQRSGNYAIKPSLPYTPGFDGAGVIAAVGDGVKQRKVGERVYLSRSITGTYAEYTLANESQAHLLPDSVGFAQGAGIYVPYATAFHALRNEAKALAGETVLIHGASGGVGIAAVQLARAFGLTVFGTAGSAKGLELAKKEGAHAVFDHSKPGYQESILQATDGRGVDVVLEMLANVNLGNDLKLLALNGRVIVIGSRGDVTITPRDLMFRRGAIRAFALWGFTETEEAQAHAALYAGLENGTLRPIVGSERPLDGASQAHIDVLAPGAFGKIALIP